MVGVTVLFGLFRPFDSSTWFVFANHRSLRAGPMREGQFVIKAVSAD